MSTSSSCKSGIYLITNTVNGKRYVGQACNLQTRKRQHFREMRTGTHINRHLQQSYNRHGPSAFTFSVLEYVPDLADLSAREQWYIDTLKPEFNICRIAGSSIGVKRSEETRKRISLARTGKKLSPEHCAQLSAITKKRYEDPEYRARMAKKNIGRKHSDATKEKMRQSGIRRMQEDPAFLDRFARQKPPGFGKKISDALKGKKKPPEQSERMSKLHRGKTIAPEHRAIVGQAAKNRVWTPEMRAKVSASRKATNAARRVNPDQLQLFP